LDGLFALINREEKSMRPRNVWLTTVGLIFAATLVACGGGQESSSTSGAPGAPAGAASGQKVDTATAGTVTGVVMLEGMPPANEPIKMNADPVCLKEVKGPQTQETFLVNNGNLANVFVYVKDGLGNYVFDTPTETARLDQKGCRYVPHVFGVRVNQPVEILNSDPTLHNIHAMPKANQEFNNGQPIQGMKMTHTFTAKEVMVPFKCDVHGWMNAYVGVLDHPYFAVTGTDGKFELKSLPPGTYTIEAWHEKLGATTQSVTIAEKETKDLMFHLKAPAAPTE
jgi:plastocyanin